MLQDIPSPLPHISSSMDKQKKTRNRHAPWQLALLNELYDKDEHPALEQRSSLAKRLGMEIKTVNAWFQNKRASTKKRTRGGAPQEPPSASSIVSLHHPTSSSASRQTAFDDYPEDDDYSLIDGHYPHSAPVALPTEKSRALSSFYAGNPDHTHFFGEADMPRKMRMRPSPEQTDELRKLYIQNPHPSTEQRQQLAEQIGMRYQSITNWFQNQRSLAKKRKEDDFEPIFVANSREHQYESSRTFAPFPPPATNPSVFLPPASNHPSLGLPPLNRRSPSLAPSLDEPPSSSKRSRRSVTPYMTSSSLSRPRRTRPEPYQLHALKELCAKTANPSIEERTALALEIGMDIGKVTNWFRNLRQTARKRASKKMGSGPDDDEDQDGDHDDAGSAVAPSASASRSVSRAGSPSFRSYSSSLNGHGLEDSMELDHSPFSAHGSDDAGSDDDYQEAVTPSPEPSPSPPPSRMNIAQPAARMRMDLSMVLDTPYPNVDKAVASRYSGIKIEDALLLLSFHKHIVH